MRQSPVDEAAGRPGRVEPGELGADARDAVVASVELGGREAAELEQGACEQEAPRLEFAVRDRAARRPRLAAGANRFRLARVFTRMTTARYVVLLVLLAALPLLLVACGKGGKY